ncbi:helix-turn-helix domain-containing protein [Allopusillimonas ginsengisoli]|uniref:helix-turn-helix domain-containing protein n=1 Tax=Allopusillimonas ginsengisoli TaxID=453575 RepID=UPI0010C18FC4|nr:helix-turn-helix transcriptional regulator [Allopusillimonas ginsengisoli]
MKQFSERLRHVRKLRGLSQAELARAAKISQSAISNYENASRRDSRSLLDLAAILKVNVVWLGQGVGPMDTPEDQPIENLRPAAGLVSEHSMWPFNTVSPSDYWALTPTARTTIEDAVSSLVRSLSKKDQKR